MYATVGGNSASRTIDATDFFTATPTAPTARGESNPWYQRLDRNRLGIVGHSGAAGVALNVGNSDHATTRSWPGTPPLRTPSPA